MSPWKMIIHKVILGNLSLFERQIFEPNSTKVIPFFLFWVFIWFFWCMCRTCLLDYDDADILFLIWVLLCCDDEFSMLLV